MIEYLIRHRDDNSCYVIAYDKEHNMIAEVLSNCSEEDAYKYINKHYAQSLDSIKDRLMALVYKCETIALSDKEKDSRGIDKIMILLEQINNEYKSIDDSIYLSILRYPNKISNAEKEQAIIRWLITDIQEKLKGLEIS